MEVVRLEQLPMAVVVANIFGLAEIKKKKIETMSCVYCAFRSTFNLRAEGVLGQCIVV